MKREANVLVLFYSTYGHIYDLALAEVEGAKSVEGVKVDIRRVPETLHPDILAKMGGTEPAKRWQDVPEIQRDEIAKYDAVIFGMPTRFGLMAAQMKIYIDSLGGLWGKNALVGKLAGVFTSSGSQRTSSLSFLNGFGLRRRGKRNNHRDVIHSPSPSGVRDCWASLQLCRPEN